MQSGMMLCEDEIEQGQSLVCPLLCLLSSMEAGFFFGRFKIADYALTEIRR